ncbi:hypothetical protein T4D_3284 [Trichinella pseudospiralis]|uniref:Uncharacterized protein n=1 Tax=Trichinella pseudospiralis TaxID=6337 RepID=A0A0V1DNX1_TRIPS|nr:hypothetical protein T4D_3284 [Trichinella pseudospiralis]
MCGEFSVFPLLPGEGRLCVLPAQQSEGECNLPCSLGRWSARFPTLERGKPKLSALKRGGEIVRFACPTEWGRFCIFPCLQGRGDSRFP